MISVIALAGCLGEAALIVVIFILLRLSQKLGEVRRMSPIYRVYYVSAGLVSVALVTRLINASILLAPAGSFPALLSNPGFYLIMHHLMLALGLTIALPVTFRYWGWLLSE
jgi:uncharacterized membrane protein